MKLDRLLDGLSKADAYPHPPDGVEIRQTHISAVFLAGEHVYKIKKPVDLGFLDFSTPEKRRHFCEEEVRLNRRLARDVYLGVVPIVERDGRLRVGGEGEPVEYAVHMRRLADEETLLARLRAGTCGADEIRSVARKIADFHEAADRGGSISAFGRFEAVKRNALENFDQSRDHVEQVVASSVFERGRAATAGALERLRPLIEARAKRGVPCDTHGDLHLDHVYLSDGELRIIDCIEFNERFRYTDPVADMAFLHMDLHHHGRPDLADVFADAYFGESGDAEGRDLLPLYSAYRAAVRAKVDGMKCLEPEVPRESRLAARVSARAHWLLVLAGLEPPGRRPALVLLGGLPGIGKSTLALRLGEAAGFEVIRTDVVRKEVAAGVPDPYTDEWDEKVYGECLRRATERVHDGGRVLLDAGFRPEKRRLPFLRLALSSDVPFLFLVCEADRETARRRITERGDDASDADWRVYLKVADRWEAPGEALGRFTRRLSLEGSPDGNAADATVILREERLADH